MAQNEPAPLDAARASRALRGHRFRHPEDLRRAVRRKCEQEFEALGVGPWQAEWETLLKGERTERDRASDAEAGKILKRLIAALEDGRAFCERLTTESWSGFENAHDLQLFMKMHGFRGLVFLLYRKLPNYPNLPPGEWLRRKMFWRVPDFSAWSRRERLVARIAPQRPAYDFFSIGRPLTRRELAIVSLLAGNFPEAAERRRAGCTVAQAIQAEMNAIGRAQAAQARHARPEGWSVGTASDAGTNANAGLTPHGRVTEEEPHTGSDRT